MSALMSKQLLELDGYEDSGNHISPHAKEQDD